MPQTALADGPSLREYCESKRSPYSLRTVNRVRAAGAAGGAWAAVPGPAVSAKKTSSRLGCPREKSAGSIPSAISVEMVDCPAEDKPNLKEKRTPSAQRCTHSKVPAYR